MILVTGGTGLVGAHLLLKLVISEEKVRATHRQENTEIVLQVFSYYHNLSEAKELFKKIEWFNADLLDIPALTKAFENVDRVYHCAALVSFNISDEKKLRKINIEGTANIVNLCIANKVKKLCYVSSIATLNEGINSEEITEQSQWNPETIHSAYAISKYGAELEVWRGTQEGIPAVIVNPGVIIGPGNWHSGSGLLFSKIEKGFNYHFPQVTGIVGVKDVVLAMVQLMNSSIKNEQFILVSENKSFKTILHKVAEALGKPVPKKELKPWMVKTAWIWQVFASFFGNERQLTFNSAKSFFEKSYYGNNKIKERIDLSFQPVEEVVAETANFYKNKS